MYVRAPAPVCGVCVWYIYNFTSDGVASSSRVPGRPYLPLISFLVKTLRPLSNKYVREASRGCPTHLGPTDTA